MRELAPAFLFPGSHFSVATPKQQKPHPLESTTYEMQFLQVLFFAIHTNCEGGKGSALRQTRAHTSTAEQHLGDDLPKKENGPVLAPPGRFDSDESRCYS